MPELIDRKKLLHELCVMCCAGEKYKCRNPWGECDEATLIKKQPTIEPEVRHGRWIPVEYDAYADGAPVWDKWECSECCHEHSGEEDTLTAFCPDCGSRMEGGAEQ